MFWSDHDVYDLDEMGAEVKSEGEPHSGDTDGGSTEEELAQGKVYAVNNRRKENAQPSQRQLGERQDAFQRGPATMNNKHEVGNL